MSLKTLKTIKPSNYELNTVQGNVKEFTKQLEDNPLLGGILLKKIVLTTGNNSVDHKLGKAIRGWVITDRNTSATVYKASSQPNPTRTLVLTASANITVDIYVF